MSESEFLDWLNSIVFADPTGLELPVELTEDLSDDFDGDRKLRQ
jgi:hypothetical protein